MSEATAKQRTGKFVWYEWMGDDVDAASAFYGKVLGWNVKDSGMTDFRYLIGSAGDHAVAGLMKVPAEAKAMGAPNCWTGYIWVPDVDAAAAKLTAAGGKVMRPPSDIPGVGRFAVVMDPYGAAFMIFRDNGGNPPPPPATGTPGLVGWHELHAGDGAGALKFYGEQFGWTKDSDFDMGPMGVYHIFSTGHGQRGGIMTKTPQSPGTFWLYYFDVDAADAATQRIVAAGGKIVNGPMEVPGGQWIAQAVDPQGAFFAVVAPKR